MNRFDREHIAGVREGLSMALGILDRVDSLPVAKQLVSSELRRAAEAVDRDNARQIRELVGAPIAAQ